MYVSEYFARAQGGGSWRAREPIVIRRTRICHLLTTSRERCGGVRIFAKQI